VSDSAVSAFIPAPLQCGRFSLTFERPLVMGILNATPDSFSDGGRFLARDDALRQAERMIAEGVDLIDIGGESTRPGAPPVPLDEELARVIPLVEALRPLNVPLSIDTYKPAVMRAALAAGADLINDIWGFRQPGAIDAVREGNSGLCAMHMLGEPQTMQVGEPDYGDVVTDVRDFLAGRAQAPRAALAWTIADSADGWSLACPAPPSDDAALFERWVAQELAPARFIVEDAGCALRLPRAWLRSAP